MLTPAQRVLRLINNRFKRFGGEKYTINEPTTILNHSLQVAQYIQFNMGGTPEEIVAGLLHDYGHISDFEPIAPEKGLDDRHEYVGAKALSDLGFPPAITVPISLHVQAKRYLVSVDPTYRLSKGSELSLKLQGGKMSPMEIEKFESNPYYTSALFLRIADDHGKSSRVNIKSILSYQDYITYVLKTRK
jgi:predicted HD phosphohydrolase